MQDNKNMQDNKRYKVRGSELVDICRNAALKINKHKVDEFEIFAASSVENEIEIFKGKVETLSFSDSIGVGIRIFKDRSIGYAYTTVLEEGSIEDCIRNAVANARITSRDDYNYLPSEKESLIKKKLIDDSLLFHENFLDYSIESKIEMAKKLEILTKSRDARIVDIESVGYHDSIYETAILNSAGFCDKYKATTCLIYVSAISKQGEDTSTGDFFGSAREPSRLDLEEIAGKAANRSVSVLGGEKIKSQRADLLLDPVVSAQLLGVVAGCLTADSVQKRKSLFEGKIGQKIFSIGVNIFDDGTLPDGLSSRPFDGEGVIKGKTSVFEDGYLKTYLYNTYTARKDKTHSTGNAVRASYRSTPEVGISNFYMEPSDTGFDRLLSEVDRGFYIIDIIGLHSGVNPISGQMSMGAKGIWIENGSLKQPVKEVTIATDILSFCRSIKKIGSDLRFIPASGYIGSPSLLVDDIMISGK